MHHPDCSRYAAVELGSDSFRLHVARVEGGELQLEASLSERVALLDAFEDDGSLCEAALGRALACLREFARTLALWRPQAVRVVATAALRMARNAALFLPAFEAALRRPIELIAGDEAGRLVYMGVASTLPGDAAPRLVLDIGSASTELVLGQGAVVERIESFPVGALRQSLAFFPGGAVDAAGFDAALRSGRSRFAETAFAGRCPPRAWGACGTVRALAEIAREDGLADGSLDMACLHALRGRFLAAGHLARIRLAWPAAARVPHLAGGLALLLALMEECGIETVLPAQAGLRVGAIWELHRRGRGISAPSA
jgi:exopolyphosphatase/guanosine-5'-triphosphate,3'-diphosphate pyrophosphatase